MTFPFFAQQQFQSAAHWQLIAKETAARLDLINILKADRSGSRPRLYLQDTDKTPFGQAFRVCLMTELINGDFLLSETPDGPFNLRWEIQPVYRNAGRLKPQGVPEALAEWVWEFFTGLRWTTRGILTTHSEIILTTRVTIGKDSPSNTIKSYSDVFYINDGDWDNYQIVNGFPRTIAAQDEAWRIRLARQGLLAQ